MERSPAKRRKTSPTTSVSIDAPRTPSRIPIVVRTQEAETQSNGRPSFASPTKASIARHNPQLLNRPSSSGVDRPASRGRLNDEFAKALGEKVAENEATVPREETDGPAVQQMHARQATTPRARKLSVGGTLSAKPRRMSQSPTKRLERAVTAAPVDYGPENIDPFAKRGLRRSPVSSQNDAEPLEDILAGSIDPFKRGGLRRSPTASNLVESLKGAIHHSEESTTPTDPVPAQSSEPISTANNQSHHAHIPTLASDQHREFHVGQSGVDHATQPEKAPTAPRQRISQLAELIRQSEANGKIVSDNAADPGLRSGAAEGSRKSLTRAIPPGEYGLSTKQSRPLVEEPGLPPTPTQRGIPDPIVTTPPTGIHETPSKRARRNKASSKRLKSSPLKPRDAHPPEPEKESLQQPQEPAAPKERELVVEKAVAESEKPNRRKSARFLIPQDPHALKQQARDNLLKELQQLQADVALANRENERLRLNQESAKRLPTSSPNVEELASLLRRSSEQPTKPKKIATSIFNSVGMFLPFSSRRRVKPVSKADLAKPLPSHLPIEEDDPFPYLQAFNSLVYTSSIVLLPQGQPSSEDTAQPILQQHLIHASHPSGLFNARLTMIVNSSTLSITTLDVAKLDNSAERELGPFIRGRAQSDRASRKDVSVICWAMGRWTEVAIKRAAFWCAVENEFSTPEARSKTLQKHSRARKRKRQASVVEGDEVVQLEPEGEKQKWTRKQLLPHMDRSSMNIQSDDVELRLEWKIGFDWTGEAESSITADARIPQSWKKEDDRDVLEKVPETFRKLVAEQGPMDAVRAVVALLIPNDS